MGGRGSSSGMSSYTYADYAKAVSKWVYDMDSITQEDCMVLESFIQSEVNNVGPVKNAYGISRGISMSDSELDALKVGGVYAEGKLSSWSSKVGMAQAHSRENTSNAKPNKVIIRTKDPNYHAAKVNKVLTNKSFSGEAESIMSSKAKFRITKMKVDKKNYTEIWVTPIN